ncbi:MAG: hypothetical protein MMC23_001738 [Stictis urceolatum]|nr:hypothetical protein [Stictis urceolata]
MRTFTSFIAACLLIVETCTSSLTLKPQTDLVERQTKTSVRFAPGQFSAQANDNANIYKVGNTGYGLSSTGNFVAMEYAVVQAGWSKAPLEAWALVCEASLASWSFRMMGIWLYWYVSLISVLSHVQV